MNKIDELSLRVNDSMCGIIAVTEVKPKMNRYNISPSELQIEDYVMYENLSVNGRGIIIYVHKTLKSFKLETNTSFQEAIWVNIVINNSDPLVVGCVYRSPNSSNENNDKLFKMLKTMTENKSQALVMGDFNLPKIDWNTYLTSSDGNSKESQFLECLRDCFLNQKCTKPTRIRLNNEPSLLDLVLVSNDQSIDNIDYESPLGKSDHRVLQFQYQCSVRRLNYKKVKFYYDKADYTAMKEMLVNINWQDKLNAENIDDNWEQFKNIINSVVDKYVPKKTILMSSVRRIPLSKEQVALIKLKHKLWDKYCETKSVDDHKKACKVRNKVKNMINKAKKDYEISISQKVKSDPKLTWQYIKSKTKLRVGIPELYVDRDKQKLTRNDKEKADTLSKFFSSVYVQEPTDTIPTLQNKVITSEMQNVEISPKVVEKKLMELNTNKSCGPDGLHPKLLKMLSTELSEPLALLMNSSLEHMQLPSEWKQANVSAIFKKGDSKDPSNYRPVSLTSIVCKTMEKIIRDHLVTHMTRNNFFSKKQFGFMSKRSTVLQLLNVIDEWSEALDQGNNVDCIYFDFRKAFDTVAHKRLYNKLKSYGITDPFLGWIQNFLKERTQRVMINGTASAWEKVTSGIPQGSVLGPILFIIYINDIVEEISSRIYLFADDTKLFRVIKQEYDREILQSDIDKLVNWSETWLLSFHPDKCKVMNIGDGQQYHYVIRDKNSAHTLQYVNFEKDIGVTFDRNLEFDIHINEKVNKANGIFAMIRRSYKYLSQESFLPLYKGLVRSNLEYANSVWAPYKVKHVEAIENVQRRATRALPGMKGVSYSDRLIALQLPTLAYRRIRGDMIETYKIVHGFYDHDVTPILEFRQNASLRGHSKTIIKARSNKRLRGNSFTQRIVNTWNSLPELVINARTVNSFKNRLDKYWENQEIKFNYKAPLSTGKQSLKVSDLELDTDVFRQPESR